MTSSRYIKNLLTLCKSAVAIIAAVVPGCAPNVNYPVNLDMPQEDSENNSWPKPPAQSTENIADDTAPVLMNARRLFAGKETMQQAVFIETYDVQAKVIGRVVQIETELTIRNTDDFPITGILKIPMPKEALVTGFAIDITNEKIKHQMVDAIAIHGSSSIIRGRFGNSASEISESSNRFETDIDVILPHGYRTVRMVYTMPLKIASDGTASVLLPMCKNTLRRRSIHVSVDMPDIDQPVISENIGNSFQKNGSAWVLEQTDNNITTPNDIKLSFSPVVGSAFRADKYIERDSKNPDERFVMFDVSIGKNDASPQDLSRIRIVWDASGSRTPKDVQKSMEVVQRLPENSYYELHVFHHKTEPVRTFKSRSELVKYLETIVYDGGTNYEPLQTTAKSGFDGITLFFTDGNDNYQKWIPEFGAHSAVIMSGHAKYLDKMWRASHGHVIRLNESTPDEIIAEIRSPRLSVYEVTGSHISNIILGNRGSADRVAVMGKWDGASDNITIHLTDGTTKTVVLSEKDEIHTGHTLATTWAMEVIRALSADKFNHRHELEQISKKYTVPSPFTSLAVPFKLKAWVRNGVEPPENLTEIHQEWVKYQDEQKKSNNQNKKADDAKDKTILSDIWNKYIDWWNHPTPKNIKSSYECNEKVTKCTETVSSEYGVHYTKPFNPPKKWSCNEIIQCYKSLDNSDAIADSKHKNTIQWEIGYGPSPKNLSRSVDDDYYDVVFCDFLDDDYYISEEDTEEKFMNWDSETPYLKSLANLRKNGADAEALYAEYLNLRTQYANSSAFYFDIADFFITEKMPGYALRIFSNLFENSIFDDYQLWRVYLQRLINAGELDEAEKVVKSISARVSISARDDDVERGYGYDNDLENSEKYWSYQLARVYDMRARKNNDPEDAQRALDIYHHLIISSDKTTQTVGFAALEEFHSLVVWVNHQKWTQNQPVIPVLDKPLNQPMDADLRIVIDSDGERFDNYTFFMGDFMLKDGDKRSFSVWHDEFPYNSVMIEPTKEELSEQFGHTRSIKGGMLLHSLYSNYIIKKADKGNYTVSLIRSPVLFGQEAIGNEYVTVTIYRNWGRPNQTQETIIKRLESLYKYSPNGDNLDEERISKEEEKRIVDQITVVIIK